MPSPRERHLRGQFFEVLANILEHAAAVNICMMIMIIKLLFNIIPFVSLSPFLNNKVPRGVFPSIMIFVDFNSKNICSLYHQKRTLSDHD